MCEERQMRKGRCAEGGKLCACYGGWVFVGYMDENGEERKLRTGAFAARTDYSPGPTPMGPIPLV